MIKIYKNLDFRVNFRKCSVQFFWKYWYWSTFSKNLVFSQNFENLEFVKFSEILSIYDMFYNTEFVDNYG